jgi:hypothetical protein
MLEPTPLSENLRRLATDYTSENIDWVKYVHDHYKTIFESCHLDTLDINAHFWEHYRLEDYLREKGYDPNIAWIVFYINQIPSDVEFKDIKSLLMPDMAVIQNLYQSYMQNRATVKTCRT